MEGTRGQAEIYRKTKRVAGMLVGHSVSLEIGVKLV
jgi:hypothetical protein